MTKIFILKDLIINVDNEIDSKNLIEQGAWEIPSEQVKKIFGNYAHLACNENCSIIKTEDGYEVDFILDERNLIENTRTSKLNELENIKKQIENSDILYKDKLYQADNKSKEILTQSLVVFSNIGQTPKGFVWKASDNSLTPFDLENLKELSLTIAERTQKITTLYWTYKEQIKIAETLAELESIRIDFNIIK